VEKELFVPLPFSTAGRVAIELRYCKHAPCDVYNPQLLVLSHPRVRRNNCLLWVDREYLSGGVRLSCPSTLLLISHLWFLHEYLDVSVSVSMARGLRACYM